MYRLLILFILLFSQTVHAVTWIGLVDGISYANIAEGVDNAWQRFHVLKIDPQKFRFKIAMASDQNQTYNTAQKFALDHDALIAINGGFFSKQGEPIGLRISDGEEKQKLHSTSWWGVFSIKNNRPRITAQRFFKKTENTQFAIQAGPRILINNQIPALKDGIDARTALCITKDNQIIIGVTQHYPLTTTEMAMVFRGELGCTDALNLDGGSSTQLYARVGRLNLVVHGLSGVTDAVIVVPQKRK